MRLRHLFTELESVKDDSQQRSWFLHEDEATICQHIQELIAILVCQLSLLYVMTKTNVDYSLMYANSGDACSKSPVVALTVCTSVCGLDQLCYGCRSFK